MAARIKHAKADILAAIEAARTRGEAAERLGISGNSLRRHCKRHGIPLLTHAWRKGHEILRIPVPPREELVEDYKQCGSVVKVAARRGVSLTTARRWFKRLDITINRPGRPKVVATAADKMPPLAERLRVMAQIDREKRKRTHTARPERFVWWDSWPKRYL